MSMQYVIIIIKSLTAIFNYFLIFQLFDFNKIKVDQMIPHRKYDSISQKESEEQIACVQPIQSQLIKKTKTLHSKKIYFKIFILIIVGLIILACFLFSIQEKQTIQLPLQEIKQSQQVKKEVKQQIKQQIKFPKQGVVNIKTFKVQDIQFQQNIHYIIDRESLQIARQYLKLGLNQPQPKLVQRQKDHYQKKYRLQHTFQTTLNGIEFPFCIVVPSYNNAQNLKALLPIVSSLRQDYSNFHIVITDDASPDGTGQIIQKFIDEQKISKQKLTLIKNSKNVASLANQYNSAKNYCGQYEIVLVIDGDDGLVGTQTLKLFNHFYQTTDSWFVYANFIWLENQSVGISRKIPDEILEKGQYRDKAYQMWYTSHPKSFYKMLLNKMNPSSFMDRNQKGQQTVIFRTNPDRAESYAMVQMSGTRVKFIEEILYIYHNISPISEGKVLSEQQHRTFTIIKNLPKQKKLDCLFQQTQCKPANQYLRKKIIADSNSKV